MKKRLSCLLALVLTVMGACAPTIPVMAAAEVSADELPLNCMTIVVGKDVSCATGMWMLPHGRRGRRFRRKRDVRLFLRRSRLLAITGQRYAMQTAVYRVLISF